MAQAATGRIDGARIGPAAVAIDRVHLAQMTLGDRQLEQDVLRLFEQQAELLIARMRASEPAAVAALAHTLKGSAQGVGAANVARAAAETELAFASGAEDCTQTLDRLALAIDEAREAIAALLHRH